MKCFLHTHMHNKRLTFLKKLNPTFTSFKMSFKFLIYSSWCYIKPMEAKVKVRNGGLHQGDKNEAWENLDILKMKTLRVDNILDRVR